MDAKIDYISWTVMIDVRGAGEAENQQRAAVAALATEHPVFVEQFAEVRTWQPGGARGHYAYSLYQPETYAAIRFGGSANHILIEMPGTACQAARDGEYLMWIIAQAARRLTRLDLAVDIVTDLTPGDFTRSGYNERFKSYAEIVSESGETQYVGSMKSERYARVYKYNAPHPRAGTLRVEHVLRSDYAKSAAAHLDGGDVRSLATILGNTWGWKSLAWQPEFLTDGKLKAQRSDRHEPGRVRWLYNVVMPALVKAGKEGLIDLAEFVARLDELSSAI